MKVYKHDAIPVYFRDLAPEERELIYNYRIMSEGDKQLLCERSAEYAQNSLQPTENDK